MYKDDISKIKLNLFILIYDHFTYKTWAMPLHTKYYIERLLFFNWKNSLTVFN